MAKRRFLYTSFESFGPLLTTDVLKRAPKLVKMLLQNLDAYVANRFDDLRLRQVLGYPAVFLGSSPFDTPSMYHLMSHLDLADGVLYPMGGFTTLIERIHAVAEQHGVTIRTSAPSAASSSTRRRARARRRARVGRGRRRRHRRLGRRPPPHRDPAAARALPVVPRAVLERPQPGPERPAHVPRREGRAAEPRAPHAALRGRLARELRGDLRRELAPARPGIAVHLQAERSRPLGRARGPRERLRARSGPAAPELRPRDVDGDGDTPLEVYADRIIAQIADWAKIPDLADRIVVRRTYGPGNFNDDLNAWRGTALGPAHILSQSAFFRAGNVSKKVKGLYYAGGSTIPGIGLPMCLISAEILVKRLRGDTSTEALPEPLEPTVRSGAPAAA